MITKMRVKNFKAIRDSGFFELKPITILCGKNSSGKSSIIQSLLLLKQTLENKNFNTQLALEGAYLHYPHLSDISYGLPQPNSAKIEYEFELSFGDNLIGKYSISFRQAASSKKSKNGPYANEITWKLGDKDECQIKLKKERLEWPEKYKQENISLTKNDRAPYSVTTYHFLPYSLFSIVGPQFHEQLESYGGVAKDLSRICNNLEASLNTISYISPIRAAPLRSYLNYATDTSALNSDGSNAALFLYTNQDRTVTFRGKSIKLKNAANECIDILGLEQQISPKRMNRFLYQINMNLSKSKKPVTIADVGFGYSQLLPIILQGLTSKRGSISIYEQPEIHLHPASAGKLANLFIELAKDGKTSIIETHSAELINNLQLHVITNPELIPLINIIFVEKNENGEAILKQLKISEDGLTNEWPDGFLDESQKIAEKIIMARLDKIK